MPRLFGAACFLDDGVTPEVPNRYRSESGHSHPRPAVGCVPALNLTAQRATASNSGAVRVRGSHGMTVTASLVDLAVKAGHRQALEPTNAYFQFFTFSVRRRVRLACGRRSASAWSADR
jgi:hypothetical protein